MIQERILDLFKKPQSIQYEDLALLQMEISKYPFMQSLRAIYLYGNQVFNDENYPNCLSQTAAYTTDKKILYQFIQKTTIAEENQPADNQHVENIQLETENEETTIIEENQPTDNQHIENIQLETENEETTIIEENQPTDNQHIENTQLETENEETTIIEKKQHTDNQHVENTQLETENEETPIVEENKSTDNQYIENKKEEEEEEKLNYSINFDNQSDDILPKIKNIPQKKSEYIPNNPTHNKHEEEIKKLIAEVEAKIAQKRAEQQKLKQEASANTTTPKVEEPISNVPHFVNTWQYWLNTEKTSIKTDEKIQSTITPNNDPSTENIKNTDENIHIEDVKIKTINTFIENNPKIQRLKTDTEYSPKEKSDDISHLMTETLANLYFEQRLYTKAIQAYKILSEKSPEKKETFEARITMIKAMREQKLLNNGK